LELECRFGNLEHDTMARIRLIHWHAAEGAARVELLRAAGYEVEFDVLTPRVLKRIRANPPAAVVIDLGRLPAQGRDVGVALRHAKSTRHVPLVFLGGDEGKADLIRQQLPDAVYATWGRVRSALRSAIATPPADPVAPQSALAGYSGTPLPKKLGIKADFVVALVNAPESFDRTLGELPARAVLRQGLRGRSDLIIWFTKSRSELLGRIEKMVQKVERGGMWIAWPKKTSGEAGDLTQAEVRKVGLANGLVDYKICAIDGTWSGLKFARRES
jgi:CheY-like chemotaxis protein